MASRRFRTYPRVTVKDLERFAGKFSITPSGCWQWTAAMQGGGYGNIGQGRKTYAAHRWAYIAIRGEVPEGLDLDHLCRNRACVNPYHLEPVTRRVNILRGKTGLHQSKPPALRRHCKNGHEFTPENTHWYEDDTHHFRVCRTCDRERSVLRWQKERDGRTD